MHNKEIIALLLAGGQGSRLGVLTKNIAKPAVLYGGKYRIIDFSLSNCVNSDIDTVGVLTQYQPLELNAHIGIGKPWDMDRINGGVTILSPYLKAEIGEWYKGTANAVFQNIHYVDKYSPKYVVILSGDHIYKMNYSQMLDFHKANNADATISVINVPWEEANRYGIMNTQDNGKIYEFEEKPQNPKSNLASMGVYIFTWEVLKEYLIRDDQNLESAHDFGKNIIPLMLGEGRNMWAYKFSGYWRDVGTIQAYWESNMDLISRVPDFNLFDPAWKIYTPNPVKPAHYIGPTGSVKKSIVAEGCMIYGSVKNSVLFPGVYVGEGTEIVDSIIMTDSVIGSNSLIDKCIIGEGARIGNNVKMGIGENIPNELKPNLYDSGITVVGEKATVPDGCQIGKNVMIDSYITDQEFPSLNVESGKSALKGGESE
ncbi:glucose-1-phosphate adenylyltransferase [Acetivibrio mesophilus]|uniref:Glucose-1-phosphate adenylyltransferase n=1 Tax=Acetivibrio mesophilus TaxID=2487273 RepID=A0A4V1K1Y4_9FIRM|nr:glucose-1-phosphate adenylyltransferase [Acetivibrio mesophilus]ODM27964.1 glucose-1-phosphate adenylyltransferase [Clostridium sp. Bc-iso-3]RXE58399.1 glucose-1-phosphate adenylyltransferase [Acetivibrio mesophilus]HHV28836.1 glucose-1-phosphate adenylyltransferase [Clostridium sp.]